MLHTWVLLPIPTYLTDLDLEFRVSPLSLPLLPPVLKVSPAAPIELQFLLPWRKVLIAISNTCLPCLLRVSRIGTQSMSQRMALTLLIVEHPGNQALHTASRIRCPNNDSFATASDLYPIALEPCVTLSKPTLPVFYSYLCPGFRPTPLQLSVPLLSLILTTRHPHLYLVC